ncbi:Carboxynorspermidine dehydrogenase [Minicystis rosea]|nr:Carboxynorspermidine dehydrogenase [Minicystis rosea]
MKGRIIVLGGGMVGSTIAIDLARNGHEVTVADRRAEPLAALAAEHGVRTEVADLGSPEAVERAVAGFDLVVGALPSFLGLSTMRAVIEARRPYCDISFLEEDPVALSPLAEARGVTVVYDAGVGPGMSNMLVGWAAAQLDVCERVEIYVGGLPAVRRWPFQHRTAFSPIDLLEEYTRPARLVEHGKIVVREALSEPELMDFPVVGTLEAFNTDGLRSLVRTLPHVPFMREKTLRYPGHIELMRVFREAGFFSKDTVDVHGQRVRPIDVTSTLLFPKWAYDEGEADITVMRVLVDGTRGDQHVRYSWHLFDRYDAETDTRSMSRTTGFTASIMAMLMLDGRFVKPGVHPPEIPALEPGLLDTMLAEQEKRGVIYEPMIQIR